MKKLQNTFQLYENLPVEEKEKWGTKKMIIKLRHNAFQVAWKKSRKKIYLDKRVRIKHFITVTPEYQSFLIHKNNGELFNGNMYETVEFFNVKTVNKILEDMRFYQVDYTIHTKIDHKYPQHLRQHLNDLRTFDDYDYVDKAVFYGENETVISSEDTYRLYYGLFLNYTTIRNMYLKLHGLNNVELDTLIYLYMYKFFNAKVVEMFRVSWNEKKPLKTLVFHTWKDDLTERVEHKSRIVKNSVQQKRHLWKLTEKGILLAEGFMDAILYKRKLDYPFRANSDIGTSGLDNYPTFHNIIPVEYYRYNQKYRGYVNYLHTYDYMNSMMNIKFFDEKEERLLRNSNLNEFQYNYFMYQQILNRSGDEEFMKQSKKYVNNFLKSKRFKYF